MQWYAISTTIGTFIARLNETLTLSNICNHNWFYAYDLCAVVENEEETDYIPLRRDSDVNKNFVFMRFSNVVFMFPLDSDKAELVSERIDMIMGRSKVIKINEGKIDKK